MKIYWIKLISLLLVFGACSKYDDPEVRTIESYNFSQLGTAKRAFLNDYVPDSVTILVTNQYGSYIPGFDISIDIPTGNGEVDNETGITNSQGMFSTKWKLGPSNNQQILKATVTHSDGRYLGTTDIVAYGFPHRGWSDIPAVPENSFTDMISDTVRHITVAVSSGLLYIRGDNYFTWIQKNNSPPNYPLVFASTPDQTFFIATNTGSILRTKDINGFWLQCNYPGYNYDYYPQLKSTSDNSIWYSSVMSSIRRSRDHGETWEKDTIGMLAGERLQEIYRLSDGDLLLLTQAGRLYYSNNDGASWIARTVPDFARSLYVTGSDDVILFSQYNGISISKSTDKGQQFEMMGQYFPSFSSQWYHTVYKFKNVYYVLLQGYGLLETTDFENFTELKTDAAAIDMMMDWEGNILLKDFPSGFVHYYANPM
jgi:hypothetical protein